MKKTILITGSTDGIGLLTARSFLKLGHVVMLHGRNEEKLNHAKINLERYAKEHNLEIDEIKTYCADLSVMMDVKKLAMQIINDHNSLDVLINNAGVYNVAKTATIDGLDVRFAVNTIAPFFLTNLLLPILDSTSRVINLSSAAQAMFNPEDLAIISPLSDSNVYAQSKLAIAMWSKYMPVLLGASSPVFLSVNPASFLASKMVKQAYGIDGNDLQIGADILVIASLAEEFAQMSGSYFDNDKKQFSALQANGDDPVKCANTTKVLQEIIARFK